MDATARGLDSAILPWLMANWPYCLVVVSLSCGIWLALQDVDKRVEEDDDCCPLEPESDKAFDPLALYQVAKKELSELEHVDGLPASDGHRRDLLLRARKTVDRARRAAVDDPNKTLDRLLLSDRECSDEDTRAYSTPTNATPKQSEITERSTTARRRSTRNTPRRGDDVPAATPGRYNLRRSTQS